MISFHRTLLAAGAVLVLGGVAAEARPSLYTMSCGQAQAFVQRQGSVVANTGPMTYERFVTDGKYCDRSQRAVSAYVKTRDNAQCRIDYRCAGLPRDTNGR
ncbi:hypothetical protein [uncultured Roseibium sp.]|uniref:hypothetical protein n=1 Tax=uncultured Roseibium sp. TaxID=1936171 RepID=UPI0032176D97